MFSNFIKKFGGPTEKRRNLRGKGGCNNEMVRSKLRSQLLSNSHSPLHLDRDPHPLPFLKDLKGLKGYVIQP